MQESFNEDDVVIEGEESRMEDDKRDIGCMEGEMGSTEVKAMDEERKIKKVVKGRTVDEKKVKERERVKER